MRSTSAAVYQQIQNEGLLSKLRFLVYAALYVNKEPKTAHEIWHQLRDKAARRGDARINGITPRFSELERLGAIKSVGERPCTITGRICTVWITTNDLPKKSETLKNLEPTRTELIRALCDKLEEITLQIESQKNVSLRWIEWSMYSMNLIKQCAKYRRKKVKH